MGVLVWMVVFNVLVRVSISLFRLFGKEYSCFVGLVEVFFLFCVFLSLVEVRMRLLYCCFSLFR